MRVLRRQGLVFDKEVIDADFWDEETLLLTTPKGGLRRARLGLGFQKTERVLSAWRAMSPVARSLSSFWVEPAHGRYPCLVVSALAGVAIVNPHDMVLVACPEPGLGKPQLISQTWGLFYPQISFSPDATRLLVVSDDVLVFDTRGWHRFHAEEGPDYFAWHPRENRLLALDPESGGLSWIDVRDLERPVTTPIGQLEPVPYSDHAVGLAYDERRGRLVVGYRLPDRLEEWTLDPLQRTRVIPLSDGELYSLEPKPAAGLFSLHSYAGLRLWDLETLEPVTEALPGTSDLKVSPSGRRLLTLSNHHWNPRPVKPPKRRVEFVLWEVARDSS